MLTGTEAVGLKGLAIHEGGMRKPLGAKKPLTSPDAFKGLTIRTPESAVLEAGIRALGADATSIPVGEIYSALRDGTVDGMEANLGLVQTFKLYEVAKYVTMNVNFWPFPTVLVMNQSAFDGLSADQQKIITEAASGIPAFSIDILTAPSELPQTLCDEGVRFALANEAQQAQFAKASEAAITRCPRTRRPRALSTRSSRCARAWAIRPHRLPCRRAARSADRCAPHRSGPSQGRTGRAGQ